MGVGTRVLLFAAIMASMALAVSVLFPRYRFDSGYSVAGLDASTVTAADGYVLMGIGIGYAILCALQIRSGQLNAPAIIGMLLASALGLGIAFADMTPGNICGTFAWTPGSEVECVSRSGSGIFNGGPGEVSDTLRLTIGASLFMMLAALAAPLIEDWLYDDDDASSESTEALAYDMGTLTRNALLTVFWASVAVAVLALLLAIDARTLHQAGRFAGLRDAWLLAGAAAITAASARRMLLDPNDFAWAVLALSSAAVFSLVFHMARNTSAADEGWVLITLLVLCGALLWRFLIEPSHTVWQMLIAGCAVLGAFVIARVVSPEPSCDYGFLQGSLAFFTGACMDRNTLGNVAIWSATVASFVAAALALSLPLIESYSRQADQTA